MTLDLGFSCFFLDVPTNSMNPNDNNNNSNTSNNNKNNTATKMTKMTKTKTKKYQITLVDCPGHASLIRTIIGGAHIIDIIILVIDVIKGWQAQTTECFVLAELTCSHLIILLNKVDQIIPNQERDVKIQQVRRDIQERISHTRFGHSHHHDPTTTTTTTKSSSSYTTIMMKTPIIAISACVGGQKVAAIGATEHNNHSNEQQLLASSSSSSSSMETYNLDKLIRVLQEKIMVSPPTRVIGNTFYFAIDHCFPIRGRGTVLTGTCLSGMIHVNDIVEFPTLGMERKIKSIQMFKQQVHTVQQGDRAGICVSNLDANLIERNIMTHPAGSVPLWKGAILLVRKIQYYPNKLYNHTKYHISVGHTTVMATVTFWGAHELSSLVRTDQSQENQYHEEQQQQHEKEGRQQQQQPSPQHMMLKNQTDVTKKTSVVIPTSSSFIDLNHHRSDVTGLPYLHFDFNQEFLVQDEYIERLPSLSSLSLSMQSQQQQCSLASETLDQNTKYDMKKDETLSKRAPPPLPPPLHWALLHFHTPVYCPVHSIVIGSRLDNTMSSSDTINNISSNNQNASLALSSSSSSSSSSCRLAFSGRMIERIDPEKDLSKIRLYITKERKGYISRLGDAFRRNDDNQIVRYDIYGTSLFKKETNMKIFIGMKVMLEKYGDVGVIKSSYGTTGEFKIFFPSGTTATINDVIVLQFRRYVHDPRNKSMHQDHIRLPNERVGTRVEIETTTTKKKNKKKNGSTNNNSTKKIDPGMTKHGIISSMKMDSIDPTHGKYTIAILSGFFAPEINIKEKAVGMKVIISNTNEEGTIIGSFGKAGKCKVLFPAGITANVNDKAELQI
jgi:selenocysteine-specific translation elongation factor